MRLTDRNGRLTDTPTRLGVGVSFECPTCGERHWVPFDNPIDGGACVYHQGGWHRTGDTLETLTLTPSIDFISGPGCEGWHGFITNGELVKA